MSATWRLDGFQERGVLGSGQQGRVVLATRQGSEDLVAIKYLYTDLSATRLQSLHEARMLTAVHDEHVARFYDLVEAPEGVAMVMEAIEGVSLKEIIREHGSLAPEAALVILKGSLLGLEAAHSAGVVHRDYKPANVIVRPDGVSKLIDFGIATPAGRRSMAGTPGYMAPEQWRGEEAVPATDVYAATCVLFECLTGGRPFPAAERSILMAQHLHAPIPAQRVPEPLQVLVERGMAKEPALRPVSAAAFLTELEAAAAIYDEDWERRGLIWLAAASAALAGLFPLAMTSGGAPGSAVASTVLGQTALGAKIVRRLTTKASMVAVAGTMVVALGVVTVAVVHSSDKKPQVTVGQAVISSTPTSSPPSPSEPPTSPAPTTSATGVPAASPASTPTPLPTTPSASVPATDIPTVPVPSSQAPSTPAPVAPEPDNPAPDDPAPDNPAPDNPAPGNPAPGNPVPDVPAPDNPIPDNPVPDDPDPSTPVPTVSPSPTDEPPCPSAALQGHSFGAVEVGDTAVAAFTFPWSACYDAQNITIVGDPAFTLTLTACPPAAGSGDCGFQVAFAPKSPGTHTATLTVSTVDTASGALARALAAVTMELTGTALPVCEAAAPLATDDFGDVELGDRLLTVVELPWQDCYDAESLQIVGGDGAFAITSEGCPPECVVTISFAPKAVGPANATLVAKGPDGETVISMNLVGTGLARCTAEESPAGQELGAVAVGESRSVQVSFPWQACYAARSIMVSGEGAFTHKVTGCPSAEGLCELTVTFAPTAQGPQHATLIVLDGDGDKVVTVPLSGTGTSVETCPTITLDARDFGTVVTGAKKPATTSVSFPWNRCYTGAKLAVRGGGGAFTQSSDCPPAEGDCRVVVTFAPKEPGSFTATLVLAASDGPVLVAMPLAGRAQQARCPSFHMVDSMGEVKAGDSRTQGFSFPLRACDSPKQIFVRGHAGFSAELTACPVEGRCTFRVTFSGADPGEHTATVVIPDEQGDETVTYEITVKVTPVGTPTPTPTPEQTEEPTKEPEKESTEESTKEPTKEPKPTETKKPTPEPRPSTDEVSETPTPEVILQ